MENWGVWSFLRDDNEKVSASRILALVAYSVALAHIFYRTFWGTEQIEWNAITAFLVAVALPYLGDSVKNGLRFLAKGK